ncbi:Transcription factor HY5-like [Zea mays]|nr:Transcription factor HY5-like [Zea mays]
MHCFNC